MKRVLVIADTAIVADAIRRSLRHATSLHILGYVDGRVACAEKATLAAPDVVVIDEMRNAGTVNARISEIRGALPSAKIVVLTSRNEGPDLAKAVHSGADAAICKSVNPLSLGMLVREICAGTIFHAFDTAQEPETTAPWETDLTPRELEILRRVAEGASNAIIARQLWVTEQTVKFHLSNVYRKLGVANRTEASHYAHVHRLLEPAAGIEPAEISRVAA